jgi:pimeloyl-ACP methyl ester carboxylesterase
MELDAAVTSRFTEQISAIEQRVESLVATKPELRRGRADILIFPRAVRFALEQKLFYQERDIEKAERLLSAATQRIERWQAGDSRWQILGIDDSKSDQHQLVVAGFESRIDGSVQPYGLVVPAGFKSSEIGQKDKTAGGSPLHRLDLWLHGRGENVGELQFLDERQSRLGEYAPVNTFVLHPYGRYSNAFKFAGETDVYEALQDVELSWPIDPQRIAIRGFSMGGAGCWQFAVHDPGRWFAANPGAGFCETRIFLRDFQKEAFRPTAEQEKMLRWYDCPPWVDNLRHLPTIAYSGELDKQKQAADIMAEAMEQRGMVLNHVIGPQMGHKIDDASKQTIDYHLQEWAREPKPYTAPIDFTTYTLRYPRCRWVSITGLKEHWEPGRIQAEWVDADSLRATSSGITHLQFHLPAGTFEPSIPITIELDQQRLKANADPRGGILLNLEKTVDGNWAEDSGDERALRKRPGLQGPIDDAFCDSFLFVLPTGRSTNPTVQRWFEVEAEHAMQQWRRHFRGDIRAVRDVDLQDADIQAGNIVAFGDLESNRFLAKVAQQLPIKWDAQAIRLNGREFAAEKHVLAMIYPNPANPKRYLVINSGFTFREYAYLNNARQIAMLPDWAVINVAAEANAVLPGILSEAGFFDEFWNFSPK